MNRRSDSVRFDPYYKLQWWSAVSLAWVDVQQSFATMTHAQASAALTGEPGDRYRVMCVFPRGRRPVAWGTVRVP